MLIIEMDSCTYNDLKQEVSIKRSAARYSKFHFQL
jgi:hypothetical protein